MSNSEKFVIIAANNLSNTNDYDPKPAGSLVKIVSEFDSDCACPTDSLILISNSQGTEKSRWFEDDCACSTNSFPVEGVSHSFDDTIKYTMPMLHSDKVTEVFSLVSNPLGQSGTVVLNQPSMALLQAFQNPKTLAEGVSSIDSLPAALSAAYRLADLNLIQPVGRQYKLESSTSKSLTSWLHLTDRCNLRCDYCYLPHVREDMSSETGHAAVDAIFRSAKINHFKQVKIKYAGGEPLLRYPLILELHTYAKSSADVHGLILEEVVLSNGTLLTEEIAKTLKALEIRLMISLDGFGAYHDIHRSYISGRGSFKDVSEAVDLALANRLVPTISITVSSRTAEGLPDIMEWILERELQFSLNFYRENELSASHDNMRLDEQKIINGMRAAFKVIENNLPRRGFLGGIIDRANLSASHTHTCGVGQNYLVFDQNGQIAKCQMHIRKPITNIHAEDPLAFIRADQIGIQNISVEEKESCKSCEWKHWCTGGCPLATYRATGCYDIKSPNCNIYKALYPEALRLEGLRLLKYQDDPKVVMAL